MLSACSRAGLLEDGMRCFDRMRLEHKVTPNAQHYGCMVDLMARAGRLGDARARREHVHGANGHGLAEPAQRVPDPR